MLTFLGWIVAFTLYVSGTVYFISVDRSALRRQGITWSLYRSISWKHFTWPYHVWTVVSGNSR